ncbi:unnamed protein product [Bathycoccus prasinos]
MFAVTTTPTSLSSSATRSLKNNASSLSKRAKCSSIVVSSSSSSSSSGKNKMMDEKFDRREMLKNALVASVGVVAATPMPALALFGIGEKSDAKYEEDTKEVINQVREVLDFPMGADGREQSIEKTRALTNEWVARYRRSGDYSGRPSYGLTYSALNAVSGHFNNFGTKYPFPAKRKDRVFEELTSAETQISRGR